MCKKKDSEISIEMLPANEGDCFLITLLEADIHILIDGGTKDTYYCYLRERLVKLNKENKSIDLLVVTHVDNDHIGGIIELLKENGSAEESNIIKIDNIWHNSYRHLQFDKSGTIGRVEKQILKTIISKGESSIQLKHSNERKEISALQGTTLAALMLSGGYCWNQQFNGKAIVHNSNKVKISRECLVSVILPREEALRKLESKWRNELLKSCISFQFSEDEIFDDAFEYYCRFCTEEHEGGSTEISFEDIKEEEKTLKDLADRQGKVDNSKTNRASISLLIEYKNKKMLFLADNLAEKALEDLTDDNRKLTLIKLPHHGSINNITDNFIDNVETENYFISTSSEKYGHPDIETLAKIICNHKKNRKRLFFNYKIEKICEFEQKCEKLDDVEFIYLEDEQKIIL